MSSNSTGGFTDTNVADYLNDVRKEQAATKAGKTADSSFVPYYTVPLVDECQISDAVSNNNNTQYLPDTVNVTDAVVDPTSMPTGLFQITDDLGGGIGVTQPGKIEFSDCG